MTRLTRSALGAWGGFVLFALLSLWVTWHLREVDVTLYQHYAQQALAHHHLPPEYPLLSLGVFLVPRLLPFPYWLSFAVLTLAVLALLLNIGLKRHGPVWGLKLLGYLSVGTLGLFTQRYDIVPALAAFWALDQAQQRHWTRAWVGSVLGFGLKLWPALLWPVFLIAEWRETGRWPWRRLAYSLLAAGVLMGIPALLSPGQAFTTVRYLLNRPVEIESVAASLIVLCGHFHLFWAYGSIDIQAHGWAHTVSTGLTGLGGLSVLGIWWQQRRGHIDTTDSAILTLLVVLLSSKIFSPQYLIWLAPWLALKKGNVFFLLAFLATTAEFPVAWVWWPTRIIILAMLRNVWLLAGTAFFAWQAGLFRLHRPATAPRRIPIRE